VSDGPALLGVAETRQDPPTRLAVSKLALHHFGCNGTECLGSATEAITGAQNQQVRDARGFDCREVTNVPCRELFKTDLLPNPQIVLRSPTHYLEVFPMVSLSPTVSGPTMRVPQWHLLKIEGLFIEAECTACPFPAARFEVKSAGLPKNIIAELQRQFDEHCKQVHQALIEIKRVA
jgi:hypothetical protein